MRATAQRHLPFLSLLLLAAAPAAASPRGAMTADPGEVEPRLIHVDSDCGADRSQLLDALPARPQLPLGAVDSDGDGLMDADELALGTDPNNVDSDCDTLDDSAEVGVVATPSDGDMDGLIDALESRMVDSDDDGTDDQSDPTSGWQPSCGLFFPFALANDGSGETRLEVRIMGGSNVTRVVIEDTGGPGDVFVDGTSVAALNGIEVFDDGTEGDRLAGDGIYTRDGITTTAFTSRRVTDRELDLITVTDDAGTETKDLDTVVGGSFDRIQLGVVVPAELQTPTTLTPSVQYVSNLANVIDPLLMLEVKKFLTLEPAALRSAAQAFYAAFGDDYDLLMFFPDSMPVGARAFGVATQASNAVDGIGRSLFDDTASWGSSGRLQSVIARNFGDNGPTLHEWMHRWAVSLDPSLSFAQCTGGHWGFSGVGYGQLGGFDPASLVDEGMGEYTVDTFGTFANGGDSVDYVPLELYLMGLATPFEVPDVPIPRAIDCASVVCDDGPCSRLRFSAAAIDMVGVADIIAVEGARDPGTMSSQRDFKGAFVALSQEPLDAAEMAYFNAQSERFNDPLGDGLKSFEEATGGRATMDTRLVIPASGDFTVYRSQDPQAISTIIGATMGSSFDDVPPLVPALYYRVDDGNGNPAVIKLTGDLLVTITW